MMVDLNKFHIRLASSASDDAQFIVSAFDSTLPFLVSIGAGAMWGTTPFSEKEGFEAETVDSIQKSESRESSLRVFIAEVESPVDADEAHLGTMTGGKQKTRVGSAMIREDELPTYLTARPEMASELALARDYLFLEVVISDYTTGPLHRGAGVALMDAIRRYGKEHGKKTLYVDCWAGNDGKLNRYYERYGFTKVADFSFTRASGEIWPGVLFRMDLATL